MDRFAYVNTNVDAIGDFGFFVSQIILSITKKTLKTELEHKYLRTLSTVPPVPEIRK